MAAGSSFAAIMQTMKPLDVAALATIVVLTGRPAWAATSSNWDLATVQTLNKGLASPAADDIATFLTDPLVTGGAIALVAAGANSRAYQAAATGMAAEVVGIGLAEGLKDLTNRPRPYVVDPTLRTPAGKEPDSSFPSGHTTVAFAGATVLAFDEPRLAPIGYAFAVLVGLSRIYEGVHYPTDVLAGAALGSLTAWGVVEGRDALQARGWLPAPSAAAPSPLSASAAPLSLSWAF